MDRVGGGGDSIGRLASTELQGLRRNRDRQTEREREGWEGSAYLLQPNCRIYDRFTISHTHQSILDSLIVITN